MESPEIEVSKNRAVEETHIHYGVEKTLRELRTITEEEPVAVLVCHGMGQQVKYETISSIASTIREEAKTRGGTVAPLDVHLLKQQDESILTRAEVAWTDNVGDRHCVHVYEAYWAPLTEGKVSYWDTVKFLFLAAKNGLKYSRPFWIGTFKRWMFGEWQPLRIAPFTFFGILLMLLVIVLQVGIIGYVSIELVQGYKTFLSQPLPSIQDNRFFLALFVWFAKGIAVLLPGIETVAKGAFSTLEWWSALGRLLIWLALIAEALLVRYFLIEFAGDVAAYVSPYKDSKFDELRRQIQKVGFDVGKIIYGFGTADVNVPIYGKVLVVGHSLGSVLAYDTLNALINLDNVSSEKERRNVVDRTRALITFGSPLDKTAFIFRMQPKKAEDRIREFIASSTQPLIVSYEKYRPATFSWINLWSPMDIISGSLGYYDSPDADPTRRVQNKIDSGALIPIIAHVQYWHSRLLRETLHDLAAERRGYGAGHSAGK